MRWLRRLVLAAVLLGGVGAAAAWVLTAPETLPSDVIAALPEGDAGRGERIFWAGGCSSCHAPPRSEGEARLRLTGGLELDTPFGTFVAPNISPHPDAGIGGWSLEQFANAMLKGVSPDGSHYYPAFPYSSYTRMRPGDVADLFAFIRTLPPADAEPPPHRLGFPFNIRRALGVWKLLYLDQDYAMSFGEDAPEPVRDGQYLVEALGHCGECHTPRSALGGLRVEAWMSGAPAAAGRGVVPNITSGEGGIEDWSESDIATLLESGFTPDFDSVGGDMAEVVLNTSQLTPEDRAAIAAYIKAIPPHPSSAPDPVE